MQQQIKNGALTLTYGLRFPVLPACVVEGVFDDLKTICALQPGLDLSCLAGRGQPNYGSSSHTVSQDTTAYSASQLRGQGHMSDTVHVIV